MNKVILIGNLTKDPESTNTASGIAVCKFTLAVNRRFKNENGEQEVDYINIVAWRGLAENCGKFLNKGKKVCVDGSLQLRNYEDKNGVKRVAVDVVADNVEFLSAVERTSENANNGVKQEKSQPKLEPAEDDELPF